MKGIPHVFMLIGQRAAALAARSHQELHPAFVAMTVLSVHRQRPLMLNELLEADDGNFAHDVFGMLKHYDVVSGVLRNCFVPRLTRKALA